MPAEMARLQGTPSVATREGIARNKSSRLPDSRRWDPIFLALYKARGANVFHHCFYQVRRRNPSSSNSEFHRHRLTDTPLSQHGLS